MTLRKSDRYSGDISSNGCGSKCNKRNVVAWQKSLATNSMLGSKRQLSVFRQGIKEEGIGLQ